jgi:hypothetical protein
MGIVFSGLNELEVVLANACYAIRHPEKDRSMCYERSRVFTRPRPMAVLGSIISNIRETPISRSIRTDPITACLQQILSVNGSVQPHHRRRASMPEASRNQGLQFRVRKTEKNIAISR